MNLTNGTLTIRKATVDDAQRLCDWWSDGAVMAHAGFPNGVYTDINKLIERLQSSKENSKRLIIEIDTIPVGEMSYHIDNKVAEIGIKICNLKYQEKGYGTRALRMLISYLFHELEVEKIILDTNLNNKRAQHVYKKIGFRIINIRNNACSNQVGELQSFIDYELLINEYLLS